MYYNTLYPDILWALHSVDCSLGFLMGIFTRWTEPSVSYRLQLKVGPFLASLLYSRSFMSSRFSGQYIKIRTVYQQSYYSHSSSSNRTIVQRTM